MDKYDQINNYINGIATVIKENKYGAILVGGLEIIPPKYDYISPFNNGYAEAIKNGQCIIIDLTGKEYIKTTKGIFEIPANVISISECGPGLFRFAISVAQTQNNQIYNFLWGVMNDNHDIVVAPQFEYIHDYINGTTKALKKVENDYFNPFRWQIIFNIKDIYDELFEREPTILNNGNVNVNRSLSYRHWVEHFNVTLSRNGNPILHSNNKEIFLDKKIYRIFPQNLGYFLVQNKNGLYGAINNDGKIISPIKYKKSGYVKIPLIMTLPDGKQIKLPINTKCVYNFYGDYARIEMDKVWGIISRQGNITILDIPCKIGEYITERNYFILYPNNTVYDKHIGRYYPSTGQIVRPYYNKDSFNNKKPSELEIPYIGKITLNMIGLCTIKHGNKVLTLPKEFCAGSNTKKNLSIVIKNDLYGIFNVNTSKLIVDCKYEYIIFSKKGGIYIGNLMNNDSNGSQDSDDCDEKNESGESEPTIHNNYHIFDEFGNLVCSEIENYNIINKACVIVCYKKQYFIINPKNGIKSSNCYNKIMDLGYNRLHAVDDQGQSYLLDYSGNVISSRYALTRNIEFSSYLEDGTAEVKWDRFSNRMDIDGNLILRKNGKNVTTPKNFDWCFGIYDDNFLCLKNFDDLYTLENNFITSFKIGCIVNENGEILMYKKNILVPMPQNFEGCIYTSKEFSIVSVNTSEVFFDRLLLAWGIVDSNHNWIVRPKIFINYDYIGESYISISSSSSSNFAFFYISKSIFSDYIYSKLELAIDNKTLITYRIDESFHTAKEWYEKDRLYTEFLNQGKTIFSILDTSIIEQIIFKDKLFFIVKDNLHNKFGLISSDGQIVIPIEYDTIKQINKTKLLVGSRKNCLFTDYGIDNSIKYGIANFNGEFIIPIKYNSIIPNKQLGFFTE